MSATNVSLDPRSIHAAAWTWWIKQLGDRYRPGQIHPETARMQLHIYRIGEQDKAWYIYNGRLYWDGDVNDGYWNNCAADDLADNADHLGHVILRDRVLRDERYWPTFAAFAADIGLA